MTAFEKIIDVFGDRTSGFKKNHTNQIDLIFTNFIVGSSIGTINYNEKVITLNSPLNLEDLIVNFEINDGAELYFNNSKIVSGVTKNPFHNNSQDETINELIIYMNKGLPNEIYSTWILITNWTDLEITL